VEEFNILQAEGHNIAPFQDLDHLETSTHREGNNIPLQDRSILQEEVRLIRQLQHNIPREDTISILQQGPITLHRDLVSTLQEGRPTTPPAGRNILRWAQESTPQAEETASRLVGELTILPSSIRTPRKSAVHGRSLQASRTSKKATVSCSPLRRWAGASLPVLESARAREGRRTSFRGLKGRLKERSQTETNSPGSRK